MTAAIPQKRPLVLLHRCSECTTFSLALPTIKYQQQRNLDPLQQRVSRLRLSSAPPTIAEHVSTSLDEGSVFDEEEENAIHDHQGTTVEENSSGTSGHSSLEDSPVGRSDSPSPKAKGEPKSGLDGDAEKEKNILAAGRLSKALRHRSVSECEGISNGPIKGILKRHSIVRSLSECANESMLVEASNECLYTNDASESTTDDGDSDQQQSLPNDAVPQSPSFKKTVRFNDLVQQALFRPNSSILGHKKRKHHQAKSRRKRTNSNASVGSDSKNSVSEREGEASRVGDGNDANAGHVRRLKTGTASDSDHGDGPKRNAAMDGNTRYAGFLIGHKPIDSATCNAHRRHASGDSALGDDEEETGAGGSTIEESAARIRCSDTKDSGIDEF